VRNISKQIFLNALACPVLGWESRSGLVPEAPTIGERFRMEQGIEIGRRARSLYPEGDLIEEGDMASASEKTTRLMADPRVSTLFEAAFLAGNFGARADILRREKNGWHMIEVKSSVRDKLEYMDDMAYTVMLMDRCGYEVSKVSLLLISKAFRLGLRDEDLFVEMDHTEEVLDRVEVLKPLLEGMDVLTGAPEKPKPELRLACRKCALFKTCLGKNIPNHIFDIPRLSASKFDKLTEQGILRIEELPDEFPLTENQKRVRDGVQSNKPVVSKDLASALEAISYPAYYLDFETFMTAIPLYPDVPPYAQIPIQYSIHICSGAGRITAHLEYLADPERDCRRALAERLLHDLCETGSIVAYSPFEKTIINRLSEQFPDLSSVLQALADRIVDLEAIIRKHFYHPDFHGSTSIKKTLPVLVPDMSYEGLEITNGDTAMSAFALMAQGHYGNGETETVRKNLLDYCRQDTLAMVRLQERLLEYA
jgi:predicted RecB family nuclease